MSEETTEVQPHQELIDEFLATPNVETLLTMYRALLEDYRDHELAAILDKIRPIQHRVTLIQADATGELLECLARDPHHDVRKVVASHAAISDEVCFRLGEDQNAEVRLALRKNLRCHPLIRSALFAHESNNLTITELLIEMAWTARQAGYPGDAALDLVKEWTGLRELQVPDISVEQANLVLQVLLAELGKGTMPKKPRKRTKRRK